MLPSSDASKPSSANSNALRAFADAPALVALRVALRIGFAGFVPAIVVFAALIPQKTLPLRVAGAIVPALGAMSIVLAPALGLELARRFRLPVAPVFVGVVGAFALAIPRTSGLDWIAFFRVLGSSGLLLAIFAGFATLGAVLVLRVAWLGAFGTILLAAGLTSLGISPGTLLASALQPLGALGDTAGALVTIVLVETLLWLVGVHGPALLAAIVTPVYLGLQAENAEAFAHAHPLPHIVTTSTFLFVFPGGAGATLGLIAVMLASRRKHLRALAAAVAGPGLAGVNEPLLFGLPLVFEPVFALPFVAAPLVLCATTYLALAGGLVRRPVYYVPASIPPVLNAFLATTDWHACILALVNIALAAAIYFPFLRLYERTR